MRFQFRFEVFDAQQSLQNVKSSKIKKVNLSYEMLLSISSVTSFEVEECLSETFTTVNE